MEHGEAGYNVLLVQQRLAKRDVLRDLHPAPAALGRACLHLWHGIRQKVDLDSVCEVLVVCIPRGSCRKK